MAKAKPSTDTTTYSVKSVVNHDEQLFGIGDTIDLTQDQADALLVVGAVEVIDVIDVAAASGEAA